MESGYGVNVQNWRMVAAAPGLSDEQKAAVAADIDTLANPAGWKAMLESKGWANTYLSGADFEAQLAKEIEATAAVLKDIGLVQRAVSTQQPDAAPTGRRSSSRLCLQALADF
jgi:putative tricarboxylic transport membrane protein